MKIEFNGRLDFPAYSLADNGSTTIMVDGYDLLSALLCNSFACEILMVVNSEVFEGQWAVVAGDGETVAPSLVVGFRSVSDFMRNLKSAKVTLDDGRGDSVRGEDLTDYIKRYIQNQVSWRRHGPVNINKCVNIVRHWTTRSTSQCDRKPVMLVAGEPMCRTHGNNVVKAMTQMGHIRASDYWRGGYIDGITAPVKNRGEFGRKGEQQ